MYTFQEWDWDTRGWVTVSEDDSPRAGGNAFYSLSVRRALGRPARVLLDGILIDGDDAPTYFYEER